MAQVLKGCEPQRVFDFFEEICGIPHPSYHEKQISDYLVAFAKERGLEYYQDDLYNVIIIKEATPGYETAEPMILQGHMDMVCEKESDCTKDMEREGLDLYVEDGFVAAHGTTLGADDGVAVAVALAILDSDTIAHPRLEFVCTVSEEVGMEGASHIDVSMLRGKKLLNLDSEEEGIFEAGCAGGGLVTITYSYETKDLADTIDQTVQISVGGLVGGHSGTEINKGRANANLVLSEMLKKAVEKEIPVEIIELSGGAKDNAIPRDAAAVVATSDTSALISFVEAEAKRVKASYADVETGMSITAEIVDGANNRALTEASSKGLLDLILALPNGVQGMSRDIEGLVETSLNLGILKAGATEGSATLCYCVRSSAEAEFDKLIEKMQKTAEERGATYDIRGRYPAWEFVKDSPLRAQMVEIFSRMFGREPVIDVMHAGVECGMIAQKIPGLDCISIGPELYDIHTPQERLGIASTKRMYDFVCEILAQQK